MNSILVTNTNVRWLFLVFHQFLAVSYFEISLTIEIQIILNYIYVTFIVKIRFEPFKIKYSQDRKFLNVPDLQYFQFFDLSNFFNPQKIYLHNIYLLNQLDCYFRH